MDEPRKLEQVKITARASVTWPEPKPQDEQAPPEQVEAENEAQEQEN